MKCLETRRRADGLRWRKYRDADGVFVWTVEVPAEVWQSHVPPGQITPGQRNAIYAKKRVEVLRLVAEGWKPLAIESETGVPVRTVNLWRAAHG
jgi:hypothetical protein